MRELPGRSKKVGLDFVQDSPYTDASVRSRKGGRSQMNKKRPSNGSFTPIGPILETILDRYREKSGGGILHLIQSWEKVVGAPIADNAKPFAVKGTLLLVHVSSSVWMHQLRFLKTDLLDKLNQELGGKRIEDIKFKIGPL
jgi:hypothetical protein